MNRIMFLTVLLAGGTSAVTSAAAHPAAAVRMHEAQVFHYYPDAEVYWCPGRGSWAVPENDRFSITVVRPVYLPARARYVVVRTGTCAPWQTHQYYREQFPCRPRLVREISMLRLLYAALQPQHRPVRCVTEQYHRGTRVLRRRVPQQHRVKERQHRGSGRSHGR